MYEDLEGTEPPTGVSFLHSMLTLLSVNSFSFLGGKSLLKCTTMFKLATLAILSFFSHNVLCGFLDQKSSKLFLAYLSQQPNYDPRKSGEKKPNNDKENVPKKRNAIFR